jgi:glycosyltransferase involved in cell wall biosynthesis
MSRLFDVLFLEKAFLRSPPDPLRGVELFDLRLIAEMQCAGRSLVVPIHEGWRPIVSSRAIGDAAKFLYASGSGAWGGLAWAVRLRAHRCRAIFLANVSNGLIPLLHLLRWRRAAERLVLLAHRTATPRFLRAIRKWPSWIVAVNEAIANQFREAGHPRVAVDYGIMDAERFHPDSPTPHARTRFVVLGALENAWKGADTAIDAFRRMPDTVRAGCELHLASFLKPPALDVPGVVAHPWMPADSIPAFLREMDVMICPSRDEHIMRETFSQAMVQGMLTGLPVLASDLPIFREKLDAGGGFIFSDAADLSEKMARLARNSDLRAALGREGRATALARYCWDTPRFLARYFDAPLQS